MAFEWVPKFLASLAETPNVTAAALNAGVSRKFAYIHRDQDPEFAAAWDDAIEQSTDHLVGSAYKRATETSDTLAIFLLKCHRPEVYGDKQVIHQNIYNGKAPVDFTDNWRPGAATNPTAVPSSGSKAGPE